MSVDQPTAAAVPPVVGDHTPEKPIRSICLDTGPLIKNDPPISTLLAQAEQLYMIPSIIDEIRDVETRTRVQTTLMPFVKLRSPRPASIKFITDFARKTGDLEVMSRPDIHLLALTYELELEHNGGDGRLRKDPNQKITNGKLAQQATDPAPDAAKENSEAETAEPVSDTAGTAQEEVASTEAAAVSEQIADLQVADEVETSSTGPSQGQTLPAEAEAAFELTAQTEADAQAEEDDDDDGWITPSNLKKHQAKDRKEDQPTTEALSLNVALLTSDYAMQNVALRIGLNLLAPSMSRITQLKNWVLRCHGCFQVCKKMDKQFCPRCGQPTLTRVSSTTNDDGTFQIHLKRNFQWNTRGNVYSIPKPTAGTASGKLPGKNAGGKNGWGTKLMLAEDQKEYERAQTEKRRERKKDLMDEDYLPNILTGERTGGSGKIRLGPGRGVNGRKTRS